MRADDECRNILDSCRNNDGNFDRIKIVEKIPFILTLVEDHKIEKEILSRTMALKVASAIKTPSSKPNAYLLQQKVNEAAASYASAQQALLIEIQQTQGGGSTWKNGPQEIPESYATIHCYPA